MSDDLVRILDGNTFVVSDERGDIEASPTDPTGLFSFDTRFLSKWMLTVDGQRLNPLSVDDLQYFETRFFLVPGTGTVYVDAKLSVIRRRAVGDGFHEELTILNHDDKPVDADRPDRGRLRLRRPVRGQGRAAEEGQVLDAASSDGALRARLRARDVPPRRRRSRRRQPAKFDENGLTFAVHIEPHGAVDDRPRRRHRDARRRRARRDRASVAHDEHGRHGARTSTRWVDDAPRLESDWEPLKTTYRRSLVDLAALRFSPPVAGRQQPARGRAAVVHDDVRPRQHLHEPAGAAVHAGAGRDDAARARRLAGHPRRRLPRRGSRPDPARDALRRDDRVRGAAALAVLRQRRRDAAATSCCSTSTSGGPATRSSCASSSTRRGPRSAGSTSTPTCMGNGYVSYQRRNEETGLENQCWKDSLGLDLLPRRRAARLPACDVRAAGLRLRREDARRPAGPARLERPGVRGPSSSGRRPTSSAGSTATSGSPTASTSRSRSTPTATRSTALTSNIGHLLWSGIVDKSKAKAVVRHLMGAAAVLRLGRAHAGRGRGPLQPDRLPRRHGLAVRQLVHRLGAAALRLQGRGGADRGRHPRRGRVLRGSAARGVRRLRAQR